MDRRRASLGLLFAAGAAAVISRAPAEAQAAPDAVPVLVELFTSEGCSSCPPADGVLARLERTQPAAGARVVPLAMHVDYWDALGWPDPFSAAAWTARQRAYAPLGAGSYTPQAVIDGHDVMVGSRAGSVERAIADAAQRPHAPIAIDIGAQAKDGAYPITLRIGALPASAAADVDAVLAVTQAQARVVVARGENAGSTLDHTAIGRDLRVVGAVGAAGATLVTTQRAPAGLAAKEIRLVVFVQERASRRVLGTATRPLAAD